MKIPMDDYRPDGKPIPQSQSEEIAELKKHLADAEARIIELESVVKNLAILLKRAVYGAPFGHAYHIKDQALDYLKRHNLHDSPLLKDYEV